MSIFKWALPFIGAIGVSTAVTHAAVIAAWDLSGDPGNQATEAASAAAPNVTGNVMARGAGIAASAAADSFSSSGWDGSAGSPAADTEHISFGFTVDAGYEVDLTSLTFAIRSSGTG